MARVMMRVQMSAGEVSRSLSNQIASTVLDNAVNGIGETEVKRAEQGQGS